jgi:hypothetical protein
VVDGPMWSSRHVHACWEACRTYTASGLHAPCSHLRRSLARLYAIWVADGFGRNVTRFRSPACMALPLPDEYFYVNDRAHKRIATFDPNSTQLRVIPWAAPSPAVSRVLAHSG